MALPSRARTSFTHTSPSHQEASTSQLSSSIREQTEWKPQSQKNQPKWSHGPQPCLTQWNYEPWHAGSPKTDGSWWRVLTKCGPLEKGKANHFSIRALNSMKRQKDRTLKDEFPRSVCAQYATGDQRRNNSRKNEEMGPKQKQHPVVDVAGDGSKVQCCKEQYCIGTWNVRSMNQGKLEVVKQEMARVSITF